MSGRGVCENTKLMDTKKKTEKAAKILLDWREYKKGSLLENGIAMNETATFIWKLCDGKTTIDKIISEVTKRYDVDRQAAEKDVLKLIKVLLEEKALRIE